MMNKLKFIAGEHIQSQQEIAIVGKIENWTVDQLPPRPKPPPARILREGSMGSCPNCGSSENRKYWLFGKRKCINPECLLSREWHSISKNLRKIRNVIIPRGGTCKCP